MAEVHFQLECSFENEGTRSKVFQGLYSHASHWLNHERGLAMFQSLNLDGRSVLRDDLHWQLGACQVRDDGKLVLTAEAAPDAGYEVFQAMLRLLDQAGAKGLFAVIHHNGIGVYEAMTAQAGRVMSIYSVWNYEEVGDDFFEGMKLRLRDALDQLTRLRAEGAL